MTRGTGKSTCTKCKKKVADEDSICCSVCGIFSSSQNILIIETIYGNVQDVTSISMENAGRFLATVVVYSLTVAIICFTKNVQN